MMAEDMTRRDRRDPAPTVALTGATGFLGSHIADRLLASGYQVRAPLRATSNRRWIEGKDIETMTVDLTVPAHADRFVAEAAVVVHCAGVTSAPSESRYFHGNVAITRALLEATERAGVCTTFLFISSLAAAGPGTPDDPVTEDSPCRPLTAYGRSKLAAEQEVCGRAWPFRTVILRPPALYGPRDPEFLPLFKLAGLGWTARLGKHISGLSLVDGRDAAAAAVALLETHAATGPYFVDDGHVYDWRDLADALGHALGRRVRTFPVPVRPLQIAAKLLGRRLADRSVILNSDRLADMTAPGWVCSGEKLRCETGFAARYDLRRGFRETLAFFRESGWLK